MDVFNVKPGYWMRGGSAKRVALEPEIFLKESLCERAEQARLHYLHMIAARVAARVTPISGSRRV